jgi:hypothetical protein
MFLRCDCKVFMPSFITVLLSGFSCQFRRFLGVAAGRSEVAPVVKRALGYSYSGM